MFKNAYVVNSFIQGLVLILSCALTACVTTSNSSLTKKADPDAAVEKFVQLGMEYIRRGELHLARKRINRALEINSESAQANAALGLLYSQEGESEKAEQSYKRALELDGTYTRGRSYYGAFLFSAKRYQESLVQFELASKDTKYEGRSQIFSNIALCYLRIDKKDKAIEAYEETLRLDRNNGRALSGITEILIQTNKYEQAQRYYNRLVRLIRDRDMKHSAQSLWLGIRIANYFGSYPQAKALSDMLANLYPDSEENALLQSSASQQRGR